MSSVAWRWPGAARRAATAFALGALLPVAWPCGLHGNLPDGFKASHASSLQVSFALQDAYAASRLTPAMALPPGLALLRATHLLRRFGAVLDDPARTPVAASGRTVALLLVEYGLWARYSPSGVGMQFEPHVAGPLADEPVIVTGEAVLAAMVGGTMSPQEARTLGLLVVADGG